MLALAPAPTTASTNVTLQMGLIEVKMQLFKSTEDTKPVERKTFTRTEQHPVGARQYDKVTGDTVERADTVYMVDVDGELVELTDDEMALATSHLNVNRHGIEIGAFIPVASLGVDYIVDTARTYQARPRPTAVGKTKVPDPHANMVFRMLLDVMADKNIAALFKVGLRGPARYAVLTPDANVQFLFYPDEVRQALDIPEAEYSEKNRDVLVTLVDAIGVDTPDLTNDVKDALLTFLENKKAGVVIEAVPEPEAEVIDFTAALTASIDAVKAAKQSSKKKAG